MNSHPRSRKALFHWPGIPPVGTSAIADAVVVDGGVAVGKGICRLAFVLFNVVNRFVFTLSGLFLLAGGLLPKLAAVLTTIPQCVLGGATITVFSTIAMTGMKLIASQELTARDTTIVGLSAAPGVGISQASASLGQFPGSVTIVFGKSPVVIAMLMAVLLNEILPPGEFGGELPLNVGPLLSSGSDLIKKQPLRIAERLFFLI